MLYAARKLKPDDVKLLKVIEHVDYTCETTMQELLGPATPAAAKSSEVVPEQDDPEHTDTTVDVIRRVYVRANLTCQDSVEIPYYSCICSP